MSNNPPAAVLELTLVQAEFLMNNCDSNIEFGLKGLQTMESAESAARLVAIIEQFKDIRKLLLKQGIESR